MASNQIFKQEYQKLLLRAKRGDSSAKKKLRNLGLLYWEHRGRVILQNAEAAALKA